MRFAITIGLLFSLVASSHAFAFMPATTRTASFTTTTTSQLSLMTKDETEKLLTHATDCAEGECSLDEVQDLIDVLKAQQKELSQRVKEIRDMVQSLEVVNSKDGRQVDEVRDTVRAIYRIFQLGDKASGNDYPKLQRPTGYTGDVGKGPTTAYDALPPKKWKP